MPTQRSFSRLMQSLLFLFLCILTINGLCWAQWTETVLDPFPAGTDGTYPASSLVSDARGYFYGTTPEGGVSNMGTVFELSPKSGGGWTETIIHSFSGPDGDGPDAGLVRDSAGNLYGTTIAGGPSLCFGEGCGVVFELSPVSGEWVETVLYYFTGQTDGGYPESQLIFDAAGNLYGTTAYGGSLSDCNGYGCGTVFELSPSSGGWSENVLYSFQGYSSDGSNPTSPLLFDGAGNLYGTTSQGGSEDEGTVFELSPSLSGAWNETILHTFTDTYFGNDGAYPAAGVIFGPGGSLFGTTTQGDQNRGGIVYELTNFAGAWEERVVYRFSARFHEGGGGYPNGSLLSRGGALYGTSESGGSYKYGSVFKLAKITDRTWSFTVLHSFSRGGEGGYNPSASLISDADGNFYSVTPHGGVNGYGTAFKLTAASDYAETVMHSFSGDPSGAEPQSGLAFDSSGNLYGTTYEGGAHNLGTVFRLVPGSGGWTESVLHSFKGGTDGASPQAPVIAGADGNLYGTTPIGGAPGKCEGPGCGTLYKLSKSGTGWTETVVHSFTGTPDGVFPYAGLTFDSAGNLYGTTSEGGSSGRGTVFEFSPSGSGWVETILYAFNGVSDGGYPLASVTLDSAGDVFGTASGGYYSGRGVAFELTPSASGWSMNIIHSFAGGADGGEPRAGLVFDSAGNLYGTTAEGGSSTTCYEGCGTVFQLVPTTGGVWQKNIILNFDGTTSGSFPEGNLIFDSAGNLYGLAGFAFELSPSIGGTWMVTTLDTFSSQDGGYGAYGNLIFDNSGNLYGTTEGGGSAELGVIFELSP
jgi:uncharacterized repeat protein (TIGR03803 family)